jgi:branched-chain amino acid transport system ATP-binding protein
MPALAAEGVIVSFGGLTALSDVSIDVEDNAVTGLIGPNGAGKSTMLGVLSGLIRPRSGRIQLGGREITRLSPHRRAGLGMARTFQRLELWPSMSVEENVLTAAEFSSSRKLRKEGWNAQNMAREAIERLRLENIADRPIGTLSSGHGRLVEVARAIATRPRVLLLDEPSAGLNEAEARELGTTLSALAASGMAILMVEHHVELVSATCSHVYVLDFGVLIEQGKPAEIRRSEAVQRAYLGRRHSEAGETSVTNA